MSKPSWLISLESRSAGLARIAPKDTVLGLSVSSMMARCVVAAQTAGSMPVVLDALFTVSWRSCHTNIMNQRSHLTENNQNSIYAPAPLYHPQSAGMPTQPFQYAQLNPLALPQGILPMNREAAASVYVEPQMRNQFAMSMIQSMGLGSGK